MNKLIEFLLREVPEHAKEIQSDIELLLSSIENTQNTIEKAMLLIEDDYTKTGEYFVMLKKIKKIRDKVSEFEKMFSTKYAQEQDKQDDNNGEDKNDSDLELSSIPKMLPEKYDDCKVDESVPHGLFENYTYKRPVAFSLEGRKYPVRDWKQILKMVCEILNQKNSKVFKSFVLDKDMQGYSRPYFAYTNNHMYNGKKVSGSDVYIETNHSANGICSIIANMIEKYNIPITSIQIYLRFDYSPMHNNDKNIEKKHENKDNIKIWQQAKTFFVQYFADTTKYYDITNFLNKDWCNNNLGIPYPLLKEVKFEPENYNKVYVGYGAEPILRINGKCFIICDQWFEKFQENLNKWIDKNSNPEFIQYEIPIYIVSKGQIKMCIECRNKTKKEKLFVSYRTDINNIRNQLNVYKCNNCEKIFIADTLFNSYTRNKSLNNINSPFDNVNLIFIKKDIN